MFTGVLTEEAKVQHLNWQLRLNATLKTIKELVFHTTINFLYYFK